MHEQFMLAALSEAWLGRGICAPNPAVGAVAVLNGEIIAQAFHSGAGSAHAEQKLAELLPLDCTSVIVYVTLEPCNHWGRTPPCVDVLIAKKVQTVVYGYRDPNPVVALNNTPEKLSAHGIQVLYFPMPEVDAFYQSYAYWLRTGMPWVTVKMAQTLDGKIAGAGGVPVMLSNQKCANFTHTERKHTDVILTTAKTINQDNPALNVRDSNQVIQDKVVAILDRCGVLKQDARIFKTAKHCIIYHGATHTPDDKAGCSTYLLAADEKNLELQGVIRHLGTLGFHDVWVEAGAKLFASLHQENLVQRTHLYIVPRVLGESTTTLYAHVDFFNRPHQIQWRSMGDNMIATIDWS